MDQKKRGNAPQAKAGTGRVAPRFIGNVRNVQQREEKRPAENKDVRADRRGNRQRGENARQETAAARL